MLSNCYRSVFWLWNLKCVRYCPIDREFFSLWNFSSVRCCLIATLWDLLCARCCPMARAVLFTVKPIVCHVLYDWWSWFFTVKPVVYQVLSDCYRGILFTVKPIMCQVWSQFLRWHRCSATPVWEATLAVSRVRQHASTSAAITTFLRLAWRRRSLQTPSTICSPYRNVTTLSQPHPSITSA